jgi:hypothetical protein
MLDISQTKLYLIDRERERDWLTDFIGAVTTLSTHHFHTVLLSEQTEWHCGVWHLDTPYLRQTFQPIFSIITEQTNSTGKKSLNLQKRVCTVKFYLSLTPLYILSTQSKANINLFLYQFFHRSLSKEGLWYGGEKKKQSLQLSAYVHSHSMVYRVHLHFLICNSHNPLFELGKPHEIVFNSITLPNAVVQCDVSRP